MSIFNEEGNLKLCYQQSKIYLCVDEIMQHVKELEPSILEQRALEQYVLSKVSMRFAEDRLRRQVEMRKIWEKKK